MIKTPGSLGRERSVANPGSATPGLRRAEPRKPRPALRRISRMEPAAGTLSPRPFPRAAAPPAPHAGPGPPLSANPGPELETMAGPPARDPGRLITDPCSGRTYFKGRLLGKVRWGVASEEAEGPLLAFLPVRGREGRLSSARGCMGARSCLSWSTLHDASFLPLGGLRPLLRGH